MGREQGVKLLQIYSKGGVKGGVKVGVKGGVKGGVTGGVNMFSDIYFNTSRDYISWSDITAYYTVHILELIYDSNATSA